MSAQRCCNERHTCFDCVKGTRRILRRQMIQIHLIAPECFDLFYVLLPEMKEKCQIELIVVQSTANRLFWGAVVQSTA